MPSHPSIQGKGDLLKVQFFYFLLEDFVLIRLISAFHVYDLKYDFSELCNLILKENILRARDKIQLTEMTENNLLSEYIKQLEAFIPFKKEITYFLPCYLMTQEFISLEAVTIYLMRPKHCCQAIRVFIVSLISFISVVVDNHQNTVSSKNAHVHTCAYTCTHRNTHTPAG